MDRISKAVVGFVGAFAATMLLAAAADARISSTGMRDTRYCEIFTVFLSPSPVARVNNTYGLNRCRQGWWDSLDAGELAAESGADLVLLNGPRYWTLDKVKVSDPGPIIELAGKRLREVATIDLAEVGLAPPPPFTPVRITRGTKFVFFAGRRVFQLTDPNGRRYVMQSYSQLVDPDLDFRDLRRIGTRISLPEGWSYRVRKLKNRLVLRANGRATIVQDGLKNTYQRIHRSDA
jgi:hypothetical protein